MAAPAAGGGSIVPMGATPFATAGTMAAKADVTSALTSFHICNISHPQLHWPRWVQKGGTMAAPAAGSSVDCS